MHALGDYVSHMASDFFNSDYLRQKVVKAGMKVQTGDDSSNVTTGENEIKVPLLFSYFSMKKHLRLRKLTLKIRIVLFLIFNFKMTEA